MECLQEKGKSELERRSESCPRHSFAWFHFCVLVLEPRGKCHRNETRGCPRAWVCGARSQQKCQRCRSVGRLPHRCWRGRRDHPACLTPFSQPQPLLPEGRGFPVSTPHSRPSPSGLLSPRGGGGQCLPARALPASSSASSGLISSTTWNPAERWPSPPCTPPTPPFKALHSSPGEALQPSVLPRALQPHHCPLSSSLSGVLVGVLGLPTPVGQEF